MKLYCLASLPNGLEHIRHKGTTYVVGKVYTVKPEDFSAVTGGRSTWFKIMDIRSCWKPVGETPQPSPPTDLAGVVAYCNLWLDFLYSPIADEVEFDKRKIHEEAWNTLIRAVRGIKDRPALPKELPGFDFDYGDVTDTLRQYRDWAAGGSQGEWSEAKSPADWRKELKISDSTLRRHEKAGKLIADKISPKLWRIRLDTLRRYKGSE
jgi:hypothetical protein